MKKKWKLNQIIGRAVIILFLVYFIQALPGSAAPGEDRTPSASHRWDFDSGDLRGLELDNVQLKRAPGDKGFFLEFSRESRLTSTKRVCMPWSLSFDLSIAKYSAAGIRLENSGKKFEIRLDSQYSRLQVLEGQNIVFTDKWTDIDSWKKWKIEALKTGSLTIFIDGKVFFRYQLRNFQKDVPTSISFRTWRNYSRLRVDNVLLEGICL